MNARDDRGFSPLHVAARLNENEAVIRALLTAGAELDAWATGFGVDYGWEATPLLEAAESNANPAVIATLLDAGADASVRGWGGETLLHRAARGGSPDVVSLLLRAGADVNAVDGGGSTPLHEAARRNPDPAVVELLLDAGADVHVVGSGRQLPAVGGGHRPRCTSPRGPIRSRRSWRPCSPLGADPNASGETTSGWTPLHLAASGNRNRSVIRVLIAAGADIGARTRTGSTALHSGRAGEPSRWFLCCWSLVRICTRWMTRGRLP